MHVHRSRNARFGLVLVTACAVVFDAAAFDVHSADDQPPDPQGVYASWRTFTTRDGLPHNRIRALFVDGDRLWVGTDGGLALYDHGSWTSWTTADGLPWSVISAIVVDPQSRDVWLGTWGGGLIRFTGGRFDRFDQFNSGLAGNVVFAVAAADHRVWAATNGGLSVFDVRHDRWHLHFERRADAPDTIFTSLDLADDRVFAGAWGEALRRFDAGSDDWKVVLPPALARPATTDSLDDRHVVGMASARTGATLWWTTTDELWRRDERGTWDSRALPRIVDHSRIVYCLTPRGTSQAWMGTDHGLFALTDWAADAWVIYNSSAVIPPMAHKRPRHTASRSSDATAASDPSAAPARDANATVLRAGRVLAGVQLDDSIPDDRVRCVAMQGDGVWVGTMNGLARGQPLNRPHVERNVPSHDPDKTVGAGMGHRIAPQRQAIVPATVTPARLSGNGNGSDVAANSTVSIAVFGPGNKTVSLPGSDVAGARRAGRPDLGAVQLALKKANAHGGFRGERLFALAGDYGGYARYGWGMPEDQLAGFAMREDVRAVVALIHRGARAATATALHTGVPMVNCSAAPASDDEIVNPWIFRCPAHAFRRMRLLLDYVYDTLGCTRLATVRTPGPETRRRLNWWRSQAAARGLPLVADVTYDPREGGLSEAVQALLSAHPDGVLTWCDARTSGAILRAMRRTGMSTLFVGSDRIVTDSFAQGAADYSGAVLAVAPAGAEEVPPVDTEFARQYVKQFRRHPPPEAQRAYDAAMHLFAAINSAGPDRNGIRAALEAMSESGCDHIHLGPERSEDGRPSIGRIEGGRWVLFHPTVR